MSNFDVSPIGSSNGDNNPFQLPFEKSPDALFLLESGTIVDCNLAAVAMLKGNSKDQLLAQRFWNILPPAIVDGRDSQQELEELLSQAEAQGASRFELDLVRLDGEEFSAEISTTTLSYNERPVLHLVLRDITEKKRLEAQHNAIESSSRALFDLSNDAILVIDVESGAILEANPKACEHYGVTSEDLKEKGLEALLSGRSVLSGSNVRESIRQAAEGEPQTFEWIVRDQTGTPMWVEVNLQRTSIAGKSGILWTSQDISQRKRLEAILRRRSSQGKRFQAALVGLAKIEKTDLQAVLQRVTEVDARAMGIERVSVWFFDEVGTKIICQDLYQASSQTHSQGFTLKAEDYPRYFLALHEQRAIAATDALTDPITAEFKRSYLEPLGITSMLDVPIWRRGQMVGIVCHEHIGDAREWPIEEQDFAASIADMVSLALEASDRKRTEDALRLSEARFRTMFEQFPLSVQILSPEGETLEVNRAWSEMFGLKLSDMAGINMLGDPQLKEQGIVNYFERGFAGEATLIPEVLFDPARSVPPEMQGALSLRPPFWVQAFVCPVKDESGQINEVILTHQNVTERKQAEEALQKAHAELKRAHEELEKRVQSRTHELAEANAALQNENAERLRAEAELRHKTSELEAVFEASPDLYFQLDLDGRIVAYHAARSSGLYVPPEVFLGNRMQDVLPPDIGTKVATTLAQVIETGKPASMEYQLPLPDKMGSFEARLMPLVDERVIAIVRDITERKETETALQRSERHFRSLIENALDVIIVLDPHGKIRYGSPSIERVLGFTPQELTGSKASDAVHPDDVERMLEMWRPIVAQAGTTHVGEFRYRHLDGSWRVLECIGTTLSAMSNEEGIVINARDVTERKSAEATLRQSEALKASILEAALDAIITIDHKNRIIEFNPVAEATFGHRRSDVIGRELSSLIVPPEFREAHLAGISHYLKTGEGPVLRKRIEVTGMRAGGERFPMELAVTPIDNLGQPMFTSYIRDISERKAGEEALRLAIEEAEVARETAETANRAKSEFLSRMSHELRTPMNSILGFAQVLARKVAPEQRKSVDHILKAGRHLLDLINEVLDIARIEANKMQLSPEPVRVSHIVGETLNLIQPLAAQRGCTIVDDISGLDDYYVLADRQRLTQVLLNIVSNAIKYNNDTGCVTLNCHTVEGNRLRIEIVDTGPGLSPEQMERIFNPFDRLGAEQSGIEGTGLGLALSKGLVEVMGGKMGVLSTIGEGCTFWIELSLVESPQQRLARTREGFLPLPEPILAGKTSTVLYIEDNLANLSLIEEILADRKEITLLSSLQGQMGLDLAWEHRPDVILLDLHLPDISGDEVLERLRRDSRTRTVPVIVISADATASHIKAILENGAQAYLTKPLDVDEFLAKLDELLEDGGD